MYNLKEGKKCVIYIRVSSERQVKGYSLDGQKRYLIDCAKHQGMEVVKIYVEEGKSGKSIQNRTAFQEMLDDIAYKEIEIDYVLVFKLSRFGRNARDILDSLEFIMKYNVNLMCVEDGLDSSTTMGKMMITILGAVAEVERENILIQSNLGREEKAKSGGWCGGFAPYGYKLEAGDLVVDEEKSEAVHIIFKMFLEGKGYSTIVYYLNTHGYQRVPPKNRPNYKFRDWNTKQIKDILFNPTYSGRMSWGRRRTEKVEGTENEYRLVRQKNYVISEEITHYQYVTVEEFEKIISLMEIKRKKGNHEIGQVQAHLLSGIVRCPQCGSAMYISYNKWKNQNGAERLTYTYVCGHYMKSMGTRECNRNGVAAEKLEKEVLEYAKKLIKNPDFAKSIRSKIGSAMDVSEIQKEIRYHERQLKTLENNRISLESDIDHLDLNDRHINRKRDSYNKRLNALLNEIYDIEDMIESARKKMNTVTQEDLTVEAIYKILVSFDTIYDKMSDREKREVIKSMIKEIKLYTPEEQKKNKHVVDRVIFKFPIAKRDVEHILHNKERHVETCVLLSRRDINTVKITMEVKQADKVNKKPTYKHIKEYILEKYGMKVHTTNIAQAKRMFGLEPRQAFNRKKDDFATRPCSEEKIEVIKKAFCHFGMINEL